jgi:hypothetical protein
MLTLAVMHTVLKSSFVIQFMKTRSAIVNELDTWTDGSLQSVRQQDSHSCGAFVLLVSIGKTD